MKRQAEETPGHLPSTTLKSKLLKGQAVFDTGPDAPQLRIQFTEMVRQLHPDKRSGDTQAFKLFMMEYDTLIEQKQKLRGLGHDATRASEDRERRLAAREHVTAQMAQARANPHFRQPRSAAEEPVAAPMAQARANPHFRQPRSAAEEHVTAQMAQARANPQFRQPRPAGGEPVAAQSKPVGSSGPPGAVSSDVHRILSGARTYHFETNIVLEPEKLLIQQGCCRRLLNSQMYGMIEDRRRSDEVDLFIACGAMNMLTLTDRINRTACKYNWRRSKNFLHLDWISSERIEAPGN
jgi:hypothetical protein